MAGSRIIKKHRTKTQVHHRAVVEENDIQPMALQPAFDYFVSAKIAEGCRERTYTDYSNTWRYFTDWLKEVRMNSVYIHEITPEMIRRYIHYITTDAPRFKGHPLIQNKDKKGLATATINMRIRGLKTTFNFWVREGFLKRSPADNIKIQKDDEDKIESFTDEQINELLGACDQRSYVGFRDYVFQMLLFDTGMRMNEALSIRRQDVDMKTRCIELAAQFNKNRKSRLIPLSHQVVKLLHELIEENRTHFPEADKVFLSCFGEELRDTQMNKRLKYYGDVTGVGKEIRTTAHTWRHTFARTSILNGMDIFSLQRILGHSSLQMVRRYVQMTGTDVKIQHDKFSPVNRLRTKLTKR
ncbi:tyrosine-type recombinase/integrase [Ammoniphilus sp. 3BR4]|uniref:tyrosine-type recombinase/integrase n=1 Tax=Ammoniphilus sp. 3BR4 TaxID=3158265 RepID=UPI003466F260